MNSYQQLTKASTMNANDPNLILEEHMNPDPGQFDRFVENFDFGDLGIREFLNLGPYIGHLLQWNEVPEDEFELDLSCFEEDRSWEQETGHQGLLIDQIAAEIWRPTNTIPVEPNQFHQFTGQQVEEQDPQSSFMNYPAESWMQVSQYDKASDQAPNYQWPQNPRNPVYVQADRNQSMNPRMVQQQMDVHEFSRRYFDLFLTGRYSHKFYVTNNARRVLARYKNLYHVLPQAKRAFLKGELFSILSETQDTDPPKRPSPNPFYELLKRKRVKTFDQLFATTRTIINDEMMSQILWDFFDYYHVKRNPYL